MYKLITGNSDIMYNSNSVTWQSDVDTLGSQVSFESMKDLFEGALVSLFSDKRELVRSVIIKKNWGRWTWNYTTQDYSRYLKNKVIKQFNNITASNAIKSMLSEAYIIGNIVNIPTKINKIYKNKTIAEIIDDILDQAKQDQGIEYFKEIEGNILYIRKLQDMKINPTIILPKEISPESSIENMKNKIQIVSNSEKNNSVIATAENTYRRDWYGLLTDIQEVDDKDIAKAQTIANNALNENNKIARSCNINDIFVISGGEDIKANRLIYLNAGSRLCGFYKIKSATHTLAKGKHKVNLTIEWKVNP